MIKKSVVISTALALLMLLAGCKKPEEKPGDASNLSSSQPTETIEDNADSRKTYTEEELMASEYACYIPDFADLDLKLDNAERFKEDESEDEWVFKGSWLNEKTYLSVDIQVLDLDYGSSSYKDRIVRFDNGVASEEGVEYPVFMAEELGIHCLDYMEPVRDAGGSGRLNFSIISGDKIITYVFDKIMPKDMETAFNAVADCYR